MRKLQIIVIITVFTNCLVICDQSVRTTSSLNEKSNNVQPNSDSIKTKRGIHGFGGLRYLPPAAAYSGHNFIKHSPYSSFPGRIYTRPSGPAYALTPGNAVVHSYNAHYPRIYPRLRPSIPAPLPPLPPPPVFIQPKPIVPIYTNRYPVFVQKPFVVPRPIVPLPPPVTQFAVPNFVSTFPSHIHTPNTLPIPAPVPFPLQSTSIISENGWKPLYSPIPNIPNPLPPSTIPLAPHSHLAPSDPPQRPNNYYLPADPLPVHDVTAHSTNHENGNNCEKSHTTKSRFGITTQFFNVKTKSKFTVFHNVD